MCCVGQQRAELLVSTSEQELTQTHKHNLKKTKKNMRKTPLRLWPITGSLATPGSPDKMSYACVRTLS